MSLRTELFGQPHQKIPNIGKQEVDATTDLCEAPDKNPFYFIFSALNHQDKQSAVQVNSEWRDLILLQVKVEESGHLRKITEFVAARLDQVKYSEEIKACRSIFQGHAISSARNLIEIKQEVKRLIELLISQLKKLEKKDLLELDESFSKEETSVFFKEFVFWADIRKRETEVDSLTDDPFHPIAHKRTLKSDAIKGMCRRLFSRGYFGQLKEKAKMIPPGDIRENTYFETAKKLRAQGKNFQEFVDELDEVTRSSIYSRLARMLSFEGKIDEAIELSEKIQIPSSNHFWPLFNKRLSFLNVGICLASINLHHSTKNASMFSMEVDDEIISDGLKIVAQYLESKGHIGRAIKVAELIPIEERKAKVLSSISKEEESTL